MHKFHQPILHNSRLLKNYKVKQFLVIIIMHMSFRIRHVGLDVAHYNNKV